MDFKVLCKKPTVIVVTGISASGKTTLAKKMKNILNCELLSLDDYKVNIYERFGFKNDYERKILWNMAKNYFQIDVICALQSKKNVIVEYPFDSKWQDFFNVITQNYGYKLIIVNCNTRDFEDIWEIRVKRDSDSTQRPLCLTASVYVKDVIYEPNGKLCDSYKMLKSKEYTDGKYTSLKGDYIFTDIEIGKMLLGQSF